MSDFEFRLIEAMQPIRQFFLAQVVEWGMSSGLLERMNGAAPAVLAKELGLDRERLAGVLLYLAAEGVVEEPETGPRLTRRGADLLAFRPWYELLIGGYKATLHELDRVMTDPRAYAGRNGAMVGKGSCGISRHGAIPMIRQLLREVPVDTIVDLGCGDGTVLIELCRDGRAGVGVDPFAPSIERARAAAVEAGCADRVSFVVSAGEDYRLSDVEGRVCALTAFSLQEVLEQRDRQAVVDMVAGLVGSADYLAVVEVDHRPSDPMITRHGFGLAYYNPYYLLHQVTEQRLEGRQFWLELFAEAGAEVLEVLAVDPKIESTGLELGFLLRRAVTQ